MAEAEDPAPVGALEDGTLYYAPIGELLHDGVDRVRCHLCGRWMRIVGGTHVRWHGWTLEAYREVFQLRQAAPTCSRELSDRCRQNAQARLGRQGFGTPPSKPSAGVYRPPLWRSVGHVRPELLRELHPTRNGDLDPSALAAGSHRKVWWRCASCGHEWPATVANRLGRDSGCPACALTQRSEKRSRVGAERSLAGRRPELAAELHPTRNGDLDPYALGAASSRNVWWRCGACGHERRRRSPTGRRARPVQSAGTRVAASRSAPWRPTDRLRSEHPSSWASCIPRATLVSIRPRSGHARAGRSGGAVSPAARVASAGRLANRRRRLSGVLSPPPARGRPAPGAKRALTRRQTALSCSASCTRRAIRASTRASSRQAPTPRSGGAAAAVATNGEPRSATEPAGSGCPRCARRRGRRTRRRPAGRHEREAGSEPANGSSASPLTLRTASWRARRPRR